MIKLNQDLIHGVRNVNTIKRVNFMLLMELSYVENVIHIKLLINLEKIPK